MPPYTANVSRAQQRALFAKANRGEISMDEARGRAEATDYKRLPERVRRKGSRRKTGRRTKGRRR